MDAPGRKHEETMMGHEGYVACERDHGARPGSAEHRRMTSGITVSGSGPPYRPGCVHAGRPNLGRAHLESVGGLG